VQLGWGHYVGFAAARLLFINGGDCKKSLFISMYAGGLQYILYNSTFGEKIFYLQGLLPSLPSMVSLEIKFPYSGEAVASPANYNAQI
jgi:hypothetical protein